MQITLNSIMVASRIESTKFCSWYLFYIKLSAVLFDQYNGGTFDSPAKESRTEDSVAMAQDHVQMPMTEIQLISV